MMTNFGKTTLSHDQQATAITVPITTMEWRIIFIRQMMENFKNTVRLMLCICCMDRPIHVLKQDVRVLIVLQKQHLTSANTMQNYSASPLSNFAKVFSGISQNEKCYRLLCVASRRFVSNYPSHFGLSTV